MRHHRYDAGDRISHDGVAATFLQAVGRSHIEVVFDVEPDRKIVMRDHGWRLLERVEPARRRRESSERVAA